MQYYFVVILSAVLFAVQFLCQQKFEEKSGTGLKQALVFSFYKGLTIIVLMIPLCGAKLEFQWFSFLLSGVYAFCYIMMNYFSLKALSVANLSVYSVFTMLGGMLLPFMIGVGCYGETVNAFKVICCLLVVVAVLMNLQKGKGSKKAFVYYLLVFLINGVIASTTKVHDSALIAHTDANSFVLYSGIWTLVICGIWIFFIGEKIPFLKGIPLLCSAGHGFCNGIGDLCLFVAIAKLDASVQFPLVTGGVMVFSTIISMIRREKIRKIEYVATLIAFVASVMMAF